MTHDELIGAIARGWCYPENAQKAMDADLVFCIAKEVQKLYTSEQRVQKQQEIVHDPAEIRRVFKIDEADYPPPDSGFAKL